MLPDLVSVVIDPVHSLFDKRLSDVVLSDLLTDVVDSIDLLRDFLRIKCHPFILFSG